jgi:hypothetical protein
MLDGSCAQSVYHRSPHFFTGSSSGLKPFQNYRNRVKSAQNTISKTRQHIVTFVSLHRKINQKA